MYGTPAKTRRGELVKSLGEKEIADYFYSYRIKYVYEDHAKTNSSAFRTKISKPDFYLPEHNVYVEYWGLIDVGDTEQRTKYRTDMNWKMKQYYENGINFIPLYPWHLNDLDGAFRAQYKKVMKKDLVTGPINDTTVCALPISKNSKEAIAARKPDGLELELELEYEPYYFVEYDCFTQTNFYYERVNLSSHGTLVIDGQTGRIVDMAAESGQRPAIQSTGFFGECRAIESEEIPRSKVANGVAFSKIEAVPVRITRSDAQRTTQVEVARNLSQTLTRKLGNGSISTKTIRPYANEVSLVSTRLAHIPIITAIFEYKGRRYQRIMQASTNRIMADDLSYCNITGRHFTDRILLCEECGGLACEEHGKVCAVCAKGYCRAHFVSKGLLLKKYYCKNHAPT